MASAMKFLTLAELLFSLNLVGLSSRRVMLICDVITSQVLCDLSGLVRLVFFLPCSDYGEFDLLVEVIMVVFCKQFQLLNIFMYYIYFCAKHGCGEHVIVLGPFVRCVLLWLSKRLYCWSAYLKVFRNCINVLLQLNFYSVKWRNFLDERGKRMRVCETI